MDEEGEWEIVEIAEPDGQQQFVRFVDADEYVTAETLEFMEREGRFGPMIEKPDYHGNPKPHEHKCASEDRLTCLQRGCCLCACGARSDWEDGNKMTDGVMWYVLQIANFPHRTREEI